MIQNTEGNFNFDEDPGERFLDCGEDEDYDFLDFPMTSYVAGSIGNDWQSENNKQVNARNVSEWYHKSIVHTKDTTNKTEGEKQEQMQLEEVVITEKI